MDNVFTTAIPQICEVTAKAAVCFALVLLIRLTLSFWKYLYKQVKHKKRK